MAEGVAGLLRDKTRPPGIAPLKRTLVDKVVALTLEPPDHEATHWTVRAMAKAAGIAASSVVKIWHDHGLAPHRWRSFKLSNDKAFAEKRGGSGNLHSGDKWIADLRAAMVAASRRQDEQASAPESQPGVQGESGAGCRERREDAGRAGAAV